MPAIIIGQGPNNVTIPTMLFPTFDAGIRWCKTHLDENWYLDDTVFTHRGDCSKVSVEKVYLSYYDGCGECWKLVLKPVDYSTPLVGWDLD